MSVMTVGKVSTTTLASKYTRELAQNQGVLSVLNVGNPLDRISHFIQHQRIHTGAKPYECNTSRKAFSHKDTLTQHHKILSGEKPSMCSSCGKAFTHKDVLVEHQKIHTRQKSFECGECGKFFSHSSYIKIYKLFHQVTRLFVCDECGKTYISNSYLSQHKKVHTIVKPVDEVNVGNVLIMSALFKTRDITLEQGLMCSANTAFYSLSLLPWPTKVHNETMPHESSSFGASLPAFTKFIWTRTFTLERGLRDQGTFFILAPHCMAHKREKL